LGTPLLLSIQISPPRVFGTPDAADPMDRPWTTGYFKEPIAAPVQLTRTGLAGDGQADLVNHGGPDKAVLAYAAAHYVAWREELNQPHMPYGGFGENFTIAELTEVDVCIGDVYAVGDAKVQVSQPRQPCWKTARRWRLKELPKRVIETGRSGWYFRVLEEATVEASLPVVLLERPYSSWSVARANEVFYRGQDDRDATADLAALPLLSLAWREHLLNRL
jgi:MOSC domain-containing protein YiiM